MHAAQTPRISLTLMRGGGFTDPHMAALRAVLVLIGLVLVERTYVRAGG